jgi:D-alanyl-D-alanine carboxypeptidase/D-alanyl-D-alanine-endopeptidase (penicillin-binding protein 4)
MLRVLVIVLASVLPAAAGEPPLQALARERVGPDQGVFAEAEDGTVLAAQHADRPVHPASVTKVATTLALLRRLGPDHRFETRVLATGPLRDGTLEGDLVIEAGRDPEFVFENAFLVLERLRGLGVHRVAGGLRVRGPLLFNWQPDPDGTRLRRALEGRDGAPAWAAVTGQGASGLRAAALAFGGVRADGGTARPLVVHRSAPLLHVIKALNEYSNNVFHLVCADIGGPPAVEAIARESVAPALRDEIVIDNGAGGGTTNRLSPRAAAALLRALAHDLAGRGLSLTDVLPVSGIDPGTLAERLPEAPGTVVGKTGTFGTVGASALVGMVRTRRWGVVVFALLDSGVPVQEARRRQDAFVRALVDAAGADPWPYRRRTEPAFVEARLE